MSTPQSEPIDEKEFPITEAAPADLPKYGLDKAQFELARRDFVENQRVKRCTINSYYVAVIGLAIAVIGAGTGIWAIFRVDAGVQSMERNLLADRFTIATINGMTITDVASVRSDKPVLVAGRTPFTEKSMNHYVVVTWPDGRVDYVQAPAKISMGGSWDGTAIIGDANTPPDTKFVIRCLATTSTLSEGPLTIVPKDAVYSESVTVIRGN